MESKDNQLLQGPTHTVVLYDPGSGRILHTHYQLTLQGEPPPDAKQLEKDAREAAAQRHNNAATLGALHAENLRPIPYKVDVDKRLLVELPVARKPGAGA